MVGISSNEGTVLGSSIGRVMGAELNRMQGGATKVVRLDVCVRDRGFVRLEVPQGAAKMGVALAAELSRRVESLSGPSPY